jgi:uncharacterized membrane-anchored protein YhcB (DUF1043 family)
MMKNKNISNLIVVGFLALALVIVVIRNQKKINPHLSKHQNEFRKQQSNHFRSETKEDSQFANDPKDVNRHPANLRYSKHAKCRMSCRNLDESEVLEILEKGKINMDKSNDRPNKCPTYALEGKTHDGQQSRMVFSFCGPDDVTVVTVIDLDTDWECNCY